jgi:hypothetical protein
MIFILNSRNILFLCNRPLPRGKKVARNIIYQYSAPVHRTIGDDLHTGSSCWDSTCWRWDWEFTSSSVPCQSLMCSALRLFISTDVKWSGETSALTIRTTTLRPVGQQPWPVGPQLWPVGQQRFEKWYRRSPWRTTDLTHTSLRITKAWKDFKNTPNSNKPPYLLGEIQQCAITAAGFVTCCDERRTSNSP